MSRKCLLYRIIAAVVLAEILVMLLLRVLPPLGAVWEPLADGLLLGAFLTPVFYFWLAREARGRARSEGELAEARSLFRGLVEHSAAGIYIIRDGRFRYVNPRFAEVFGYPEDVIAAGMPFERLVHPDDIPLVREQVRRRQAGEAPTAHYTFRGLRSDQATIEVEIFGAVAEFEGSRAVIGTLVDITERRRVEARCARQAQVQGALIELLRISLRDVRIEQALGQALDSILALDWLALQAKGAVFLTGPEPEMLRMAVSRNLPEGLKSACARVPFGRCLCGLAAREGRLLFSSRLDALHTTTYEGMRPHGHYCLPLKLDGKVAGLVVLYVREGHVQDPSEAEFLAAAGHVLEGMLARQRLSEALVQSQKMEAVGRLAGGLSHDFGNLLNAVSGTSELLLADLPPGDRKRPEIETILGAARRAAELVRQLMTFGRKQAAPAGSVDLNSVVSDMEGLLRRMLGGSVQLVLRLGAGLEPVLSDKVRLEQVLMNLAVNAKDAMPDGGRLVIETAAAGPDVPGASFAPGTSGSGRAPDEPAAGVVLTVSDTGCGMPPEVRDRLFEPFFTTKAPGKGTGLGLSTVYGMLQQDGGSILVDTCPGRGTSFRVYFRAAPKDSPVPAGVSSSR